MKKLNLEDVCVKSFTTTAVSGKETPAPPTDVAVNNCTKGCK